MVKQESGGSCIVENTTKGLERNVEFMKKVSQETGVHIVAPSGYYVDASHRADMTQLKVSELADEMTTDILEGCDGTKIKCGVIGELGCSWPLTSETCYFE